MKQFTKEEAIKFGEEEKWRLMTHTERAAFQLLQDKLCMPFDVAVIENRDVPANEFPVNAQLPLLKDEEKVFEGTENIIDHLTDLGKFQEQWYKYQSDVCYCDENGNAE